MNTQFAFANGTQAFLPSAIKSFFYTLTSNPFLNINLISSFAFTIASCTRLPLEALIEKLASIYLSKSYIDKMTFHDLYDEWLDYKTGITTNPNTILRHKQHYKKYLTTSVLDKKRVLSIDDLLLETECNRIVRDFNLSSNEWTNLKTIIKGMFEYATRKHYLTVNPFLNVSIRVKFRQVVGKSGRTDFVLVGTAWTYESYNNHAIYF